MNVSKALEALDKLILEKKNLVSRLQYLSREVRVTKEEIDLVEKRIQEYYKKIEGDMK